jgi:hypothetical protein
MNKAWCSLQLCIFLIHKLQRSLLHKILYFLVFTVPEIKSIISKSNTNKVVIHLFDLGWLDRVLKTMSLCCSSYLAIITSQCHLKSWPIKVWLAFDGWLSERGKKILCINRHCHVGTNRKNMRMNGLEYENTNRKSSTWWVLKTQSYIVMLCAGFRFLSRNSYQLFIHRE